MKMKQIKFVGAVVAAFLLLLTSCLGETSNSGELYGVPGKVRISGAKVLIDTYQGTLYTTQLSIAEYYGGEWLYVSFSYDMDSEENANADANGYLYVTLLQNPTTIPDGQIAYYSDTTKVMNDSEIALTEGAYNILYYQYFCYIDGDLMITSEYKALTDQRMNFYLYYDSNQEPYVSEGRNTYTFYVRGEKRGEDGKTPTVTYQMPYYYDVRTIMNSIETREKNAGNKSYNLDFRYIDEIDEETGEISWKSSSSMIYFNIAESE